MPYGFNDDKSKADLSDVLRESDIADIMGLAYPVGSIYMSTVNTNPSAFFGGTWIAWGSGRVPVGVSSDAEFNTVEKTGGEKTHKLVANEMPKHAHSYNGPKSPTGSTTVSASGTAAMLNNTGVSRINTFVTQLRDVLSAMRGSMTAAHGRDSNIPIVPASVPSMSTLTTTNVVTGISGGAHTHTVSSQSLNSGTTGGDAAHNNLQPYITCYMWKRTE